ncbi:MAG: hypothetical protein B6244_08550 [Candidatus Cloacimonetes bacterium 4572_55]|nr:MAG: hypothetical protein B6244_08550 [Candidatus Cloacimonetes bacterium 4572_55]
MKLRIVQFMMIISLVLSQLAPAFAEKIEHKDMKGNDGKADHWIFSEGGKKVAVYDDNNNDEKPDSFEYYDNDGLYLHIKDTNYDGQNDQ